MSIEPIYHLPSWLLRDEDLYPDSPKNVNLNRESFRVGPNSHFWASQGIEEPVVSPLAERTLPQEKDSSNIPKPSLPCPSTAKPLRNVTREKDSPEVLHKLIRKWNQTPEELKRKLYETPAVNRKGVELRNPYFYTSFFKHVFKGSAYFTVAHQAFQEAVDNNQINNIVCNEFINVAGKTGHYVEAKEAFDIAFERGCMDQWTINSFINIAGINNQWDDAGEAFTLACQKGLCDNVTGNTLIENAGKSKNFELAQRIFNRMLEMPGLADAFTFSSYIKTAGICHQFQECQRAYLLAKERAQEDDQILNSYVFNHFIFAASKCGKFNEAKIAYEEAVRAGHADTHVQNTYNIILINQKKRFSKY